MSTSSFWLMVMEALIRISPCPSLVTLYSAFAGTVWFAKSTAGTIASPSPGHSMARDRNMASSKSQSSNWIKQSELESSSWFSSFVTPSCASIASSCGGGVVESHQICRSQSKSFVDLRKEPNSACSFRILDRTAGIKVVPSKSDNSVSEYRVGKFGMGRNDRYLMKLINVKLLRECLPSEGSPPYTRWQLNIRVGYSSLVQ